MSKPVSTGRDGATCEFGLVCQAGQGPTSTKQSLSHTFCLEQGLQAFRGTVKRTVMQGSAVAVLVDSTLGEPYGNMPCLIFTDGRHCSKEANKTNAPDWKLLDPGLNPPA